MKGKFGVSMNAVERKPYDKKQKYKKQCNKCSHFILNNHLYKKNKSKTIKPYCCELTGKELYYTSKMMCHNFEKEE